ncbi:unnamed protein product, partial [Eretmochelys imbricata]
EAFCCGRHQSLWKEPGDPNARHRGAGEGLEEERVAGLEAGSAGAAARPASLAGRHGEEAPGPARRRAQPRV